MDRIHHSEHPCESSHYQVAEREKHHREPALGVFDSQIKAGELQKYSEVVMDQILVISLEGKKYSPEKKRYKKAFSSGQLDYDT